MVLIQGYQIHLRDWQVEDLTLYAHWQSPEHLWRQLDGPYDAKRDTQEIAKQVEAMRPVIEKAEWPNPRRRLVIADRTNDQLIGTVSWYWIGEETNWLAQGIVIFDDTTWRRGIGYEALGLWSQYLFDTLPRIVRLDLRTWSGNLGMQALARKLGYLEEARFRKARIVDDVYYDGLGFGILREEWQARYPKGFAQQMLSGEKARSDG